MNRDTHEMLNRLERVGISSEDAFALRRISMTLQRWHELECGDSNGYVSYCVVRGKQVNGDFEYDDKGDAYMESSGTSGPNRYRRIPDREKGAKKRLDAIMARYPGLSAYIQGDPRGAALWILREGDVPAGEDVNGYYTRGIAVYK